MADTENEKMTTATETETTQTVDNSDALTKEIEKLKRQLSSANSEAANYKRALREKQTAEEQAAADTAEKQKAMEEELAMLRKDKTTNAYKAKYMGIGFDEAMAQTTAEAMVNGDMDSVFANLKTLTDNITKSATAKIMDSQANLTNGAPPTGADLQKQQEAEIRKAFGL